jgi:uncharacterized protein (TIGR02444 family)
VSGAAASFWDWALAAYDRPGVAEACLALQDDHGQQTAYLLWAAWASPPAGALADGAELARHWETAILGPVRQSRRALKTPLAPVEDDARLAVRETVKAVELDLERLLMAALERLSPPAAGEALENLVRAGEAWGDPPPREALTRLSRALA